MSAKSLVLISGKGGSGKTTIGICMATMLADCGQKVLFVDCDLSTNGATYFYEDKIDSVDDRVISFTDLLGYVADQEEMGSLETIRELKENKAQYLIVDKGVYFIPSVLPRDLRTNHLDGINIKLYLDAFCSIYDNYIKTQFDIVIFDCQAGYSSILDLILPVSDSLLLVMEADAISSAAARNLHIRIASSVKKTKMYQIFSKVTEEEKQIYGQVKLGTFYTTIDAILYDTNVRNAFAFAEIPDLMNTKSGFGMQIYDICVRVFSSLNMEEILKKYRLIFKYNILLGKIEDNRPSKRLWAMLFAFPFVTIASVALGMLIYFFEAESEILFSRRSDALISFLLIMLFYFTYLIGTISGTGDFWKLRDRKKYRMERERLLKENPELEKYISEYLKEDF